MHTIKQILKKPLLSDLAPFFVSYSGDSASRQAYIQDVIYQQNILRKIMYPDVQTTIKNFKLHYQILEKYTRKNQRHVPIINRWIYQPDYQNSRLDYQIDSIKNEIISSLPKKVKNFGNMIQIFPYQQKFMISKMILEYSDNLLKQQSNISETEKILIQQKLVDLAFCAENIVIALFMHKMIESIEKLRQRMPKILDRLILDRISEQKLVLGGDFFHVKASLKSSQIGYLEIPQYFSIIQEETSQGVCLQEQLKLKAQSSIDQDSISLQDLYSLAFYETASITSFSFMAAHQIITGNQNDANLEKSFQIGFKMGLALHFQESIKDFLFYWQHSVSNALNRNNCSPYSGGMTLPNYFLYMGIQENLSINEIFINCLRLSDSHIQNLLKQSDEISSDLKIDFNAQKRLLESFLSQF